MRPDELIEVYSVTDPNKAELIKLELQNIGIHCVIDGENQAGLSNVLAIKILVAAVDADAARRFVIQHETQPTP